MNTKFEYLKSINADYIEELFSRFLKDPDSVDASWRFFFEGMELGEESSRQRPALSNGKALTNGVAASTTSPQVDFSSEAKVASLINAYREMGRVIASVDPLGEPPLSHPLLDIGNFDLKPSDLTRTFSAGRLLGMENARLSEIIERLREIYCASIGVEYTHIQDPESRKWLQQKMETSRNREVLPAEEKQWILKRLIETETFERFIHTRYVAQKRFSIEGGDTLIPALDRIIETAADLGANRLVMGMAHRGRLNVLLNTFKKNAEYIFAEFEENFEGFDTLGIGDVKYHMGYSADITTRHGNPVHLTLANNPSHLEFVNPVVEGIARSKQRAQDDVDRTQVVPLLIHGDAAFAGQGVVYETLNLSQLSGFRTGGTIHVVLNNQVGFTTDPESSRSTTYATDVAKMLEVPIFHVNGDDAEAVYYVSRLSTEYRQKFHRDVVIDLICYRKYGHNEGDDPSFTQPCMYRKIKTHPSPREIYAERLHREGVFSSEQTEGYIESVTGVLSDAQTLTREKKPRPFVSSFDSNWKSFHAASVAEVDKPVDTTFSSEKLLEIAEKLRKIPEGFHLHPKLERFLDARLHAVREGKGIDWGNAEALAFATLILEGHVVRLTGQDAERGTFSHRHSVLNDYETGKKFTPLNTLVKRAVGEYIVRNSHLSETAVLGFEYGWSLADPTATVIWEAQFGDFANGAQVIIDQFITGSEVKWQRSSGIVLLLPHGYEGQGPEHSSARLERFLQLSADNNIAVCNLTTPAQYFHVLRRQMKREFRKPLVIMSPKSLLRHPMALSDLKDLAKGQFQALIDDPAVTQPKKVKRVLLCSGKIYYDLVEERQEQGLEDTAIVRIEQLYPWPQAALKELFERYSHVSDIRWVQEEPRNMGAWTYLFNQWAGGLDHFAQQIGGRLPAYIGRNTAAVPANGARKLHTLIQKKIVVAAFADPKKP